MPEETSRPGDSGRAINILIVEDNEADIKIALRAFAKVEQKSDIYVVHNGEEALDFIHHRGQYEDKSEFPAPDIILLDINMPKMDGFGFLERIKADPEYNHIPVVMLTTSRDEGDISRSYKYGAAGYIQKPVSYDDFLSFVNGFDLYWRNINKLPDSKDNEKR